MHTSAVRPQRNRRRPPRARDLELTCNLFWSDELTDAQKYVEMGIDVVLTNAAHKLLALVPVPGR